VVWIDCDGLALAVVVHDALSLQPGDPLRFDIDVAQVSLFNRDTEQRL
jgi:hypothetical protein